MKEFCGVEDAYVLVVKDDLEVFSDEEIHKVEELLGIDGRKNLTGRYRVRFEVYGDNNIKSNVDYYYIRYEDFLEQCSQSEHQEEEQVWWVL